MACFFHCINLVLPIISQLFIACSAFFIGEKAVDCLQLEMALFFYNCLVLRSTILIKEIALFDDINVDI